MTWEGVACPDPWGTHAAMTTTENRPVVRTAVDGAWRLNVLGPVELCYDDNPVADSVATRLRETLAAMVEVDGELTVVSGLRLGAEQLGADDVGKFLSGIGQGIADIGQQLK